MNPYISLDKFLEIQRAHDTEVFVEADPRSGAGFRLSLALGNLLINTRINLRDPTQKSLWDVISSKVNAPIIRTPKSFVSDPEESSLMVAPNEGTKLRVTGIRIRLPKDIKSESWVLQIKHWYWDDILNKHKGIYLINHKSAEDLLLDSITYTVMPGGIDVRLDLDSQAEPLRSSKQESLEIKINPKVAILQYSWAKVLGYEVAEL
ncbi:MAG: hypothetical protein GWN00_01305 [Aliifodinibius sp.]|nr:hypothetical protein [Fodinibius sp.]NIV09969.1 hypothetical protein [Fodinibius sp.]NIY23499.1 hypothetical protein [Fodinibius sp.]